MKNRLIAIGLTLIVGTFAGCISQEFGTKLDPAKVAQIKKGSSTRAEVEALLGPPINVSMAGEGKRIMSYSYTATNSRANPSAFIPIVGLVKGGAKGETQSQRLQIMLNASGIVEDFEFSDGTQKIESSTWGASTKVTPVTSPTAAPEKK